MFSYKLSVPNCNTKRITSASLTGFVKFEEDLILGEEAQRGLEKVTHSRKLTSDFRVEGL